VLCAAHSSMFVRCVLLACQRACLIVPRTGLLGHLGRLHKAHQVRAAAGYVHGRVLAWCVAMTVH
jgi:hypothetical protein